MKYLKYIVVVLIWILPASLFAQDITGLWKGTIYNDTTQLYYKYEIAISKEKGKYTGFSHTWFIKDDKQFYGVKKIKIKVADDGKIITEDDGLIANNYPIPPNKNVRQLNVLSLDDKDSIMKLTGPYTTNRTKEYVPLTGTVYLQRKNDFWQSSLVPHLQELGKEQELSFVKEETEMLAKQDAKKKEEKAQSLKEQELLAKENAKAELAKQQLLLKEEADRKEAAALIAKQEANAKALAEQKRLEEQAAKQEALKQQEIAKQKAIQAKDAEAKLLAQQEADAKALAEKKKMEEFAAKQEALRQQEIAKQKAIQAKDAEAKLLAQQQQAAKAKEIEKENAARLQAKQEADAKINMEKKLAQQSQTFSANGTLTAAAVNSRTTVLQQTVSFSSDSLQLSLYDNGEVDGDTVSVLMNGQLILEKQGLSTTAIKKTIYIPSNIDRVELVMYAESLGSIPPNTGLLVIKDSKNLYEIRFSGDMQKNASIVFNRKKE